MKPTELAITLAALTRRPALDGWLYADEIRGGLRALGFDATAQQVAAWLRPMCEVDAPWLERERGYDGMWRYRVTRYGLNDVENQCQAIRIWRP